MLIIGAVFIKGSETRRSLAAYVYSIIYLMFKHESGKEWLL
ncbi:hypothetical protein DFQ01_14923 [Paenibacillus cellulosilyticus]|uniref:Uncharacterized protein n=1 Tax=Paenibacillus cellulosilyticus TaxID=375489 RepID=A0A2V2YBW3_9BACL|nr:hypothetical protein DFQ01_14923 [Paenibacillus cellulosilyticus]